MRKLHSTLQLPALGSEGVGLGGGRKVGHQLRIGRRSSSEDFFTGKLVKNAVQEDVTCKLHFVLFSGANSECAISP